jgi:hypothetical protein
LEHNTQHITLSDTFFLIIPRRKMPLDKTGPCPFAGDHWPRQWGGQKITPKTFSSLHSGQKKDLIEYYYKHQYTTAPFKSLKPYPFPNIRLKEYLGIFPENLKRTVLKTPEYYFL